jgi:hypothetical protein
MPTSPPSFLRHLIDDAAIFPPGNMPLPDAVREHLSMSSLHRDVVGPFVVDVPRLFAAAESATEEDGVLDVSVVVRPPARIDDLLGLVAAHRAISLAGLEVVVTATGQELDDELTVVSRTIARADRALEVWIELGWERTRAQWDEDLRTIAGHGFLLKLRTGGVTASAYPTVPELADALMAAADGAVPFKCTAGLHAPARHYEPAVGSHQHGFLNILIATARARVGASADEIHAILALEDAGILVQAMGVLSDDEMSATRELFRSYGSCSIDEPLAELRLLGLLEPEGAR